MEELNVEIEIEKGEDVSKNQNEKSKGEERISRLKKLKRKKRGMRITEEEINVQHGADKLQHTDAQRHQGHGGCHEIWSQGNEERVQESGHWKN